MSNTKVMPFDKWLEANHKPTPNLIKPEHVTAYAEHYHAAQSIQGADNRERELKEHFKEGYDRAVVDMSKVRDWEWLVEHLDDLANIAKQNQGWDGCDYDKESFILDVKELIEKEWFKDKLTFKTDGDGK